MARVAHLTAHLTTEELARRYRSAPDVVEARRWHLLRLVAAKTTIKAAAREVGLNYDYARELIRRCNEQGPDALRNRSREKVPPQPRPLLPAEQQAELRVALAGPAPDGGRWNGPKVAQWIKDHTGKAHIHPQRGWDYLRRLDHTPHIPRPRHQDTDPAAQAAFKQTSANA